MQDTYTYYHSKQSILERMLSHAAMYYGVGHFELLDPVMRLFIESIGEEIYTVSEELGHMEDRILDKICGMLMADSEMPALPVHGILSALPLESVSNIGYDSEFYADTPEKKLAFYPAVNTRLYSGVIRHLIQGGQIFNIGRQQNRILQFQNGNNVLQDNILYVGLEIDDSIEDIKGLSFYVDFKGSYNKKSYLEQLSFSSWRINDAILSLSTGIYTQKETFGNSTEELFALFEASNKVNRIVKKQYDPHFLTIRDSFDITGQKSSFPEKLKYIFTEAVTSDFNKPLLWIEITFPQSIPYEVLQNIQVGINFIPVVCKRLIKKTEEINKEIPILTLNTEEEESFISVKSVTDSTGKVHYDFPAMGSNAESTVNGVYSLRQKGLERPDKKEINEYLHNITSDLNYEVFSYFRNRKDIKADLKQAYNASNDLLRELRNMTHRSSAYYEPKHYLILDTCSDSEIYFVEYWVADYKIGGYIRSGQELNTNSIPQSSLSVLVDIRQGASPCSRNDNYTSYKNRLTRNKLLITDKDIELFCMEHFQDTISQVRICKGIMEAPNGKGGFVRTKNIYMQLKKGITGILNENAACHFQKILESHSPATFRYRIFIDEKMI